MTYCICKHKKKSHNKRFRCNMCKCESFSKLKNLNLNNKKQHVITQKVNKNGK